MRNLAKISFVITDDSYMKTDVISQPINDTLPSGIHYLGEITLNTNQINRQAKQYGVSPDQELARVAAHGVLHLLGYTDNTPKAQKAMEAIQESVVKEIFPNV